MSELAALSASTQALVAGEIDQRTAPSAALRPYLRLYTNISLTKLADYAKMSTTEARGALATMKAKSVVQCAAALSAASGSEGTFAVDPLHFVLRDDTVTPEEARVAFNPALWFLRGIEALQRLAKDNYRVSGGRGRRGGAVQG